VTDSEGKVILLGDRKMITDLSTLGKDQGRVHLPDISSVLLSQEDRWLRSVYGATGFTVEAMVRFTHNTFHVPWEELEWMASGAITDTKVEVHVCMLYQGAPEAA
jgi:hypothetical protein